MNDAPRAGWREWIGVAVLALPTLLIGLDMTVLHLAVPRLSADLSPSSSQQLWIVDIYGFLIAGFLLTMGNLGDRIGRRRLLMIGAAVFGTASLLAAFSVSAEMLIATRALLGIAGATLMPSTLSLIRNMFPDDSQRTVAISVWMMSLLAGQAIGPLAGGTLLVHFWWGSVFLLAVPVMVLLLVLAPVFLPEYRDSEAGRLDLVSVALSLVAILSIIYGLKEIATHGLGWLPALSAVAGLIASVAFVHRQRKLADPIMDLGLFARGTFSVSVTTHLVSLFVLTGIQYLIAQYLQLVLGLSPLQAGLLTIPPAIGGLLGAMLAPAISRGFGSVRTISAGLFFGAVGLGILTQVRIESGVTVLLIGFILVSFAVGLVTALTTDLIIGSAPPERAGAASGISETSAELGIALGIAILGSIAAAIYRNRVTGEMLSGVPSEATGNARETLAGAVSEAGQLPPDLAVQLLEPTREAFTTGLNIVAAIGAIAMTAIAITVIALLGHKDRRDESHIQALPEKQ